VTLFSAELSASPPPVSLRSVALLFEARRVQLDAASVAV
jgi:hypothetical protein